MCERWQRPYRYLPGATFEVHDLVLEREIGLETWVGDSEDKHAHDGADTFGVRDHLITAQTIHFSVRDDGDGNPSSDDR